MNWFNTLPPGKINRFDPNEIIISPGASQNQLIAIESGTARICLFAESREQTLGYLKPESVYVTHTPTWVIAMEPTITRSWPLRLVHDLFKSHPEVAIETIRDVGILLKNTIEMIEDLAFRSVESRLAKYLLTEVEQQGSNTIKLIGNTEILASLLGTSRQTTSTIINKMIKNHLIEKQNRQQIKIIAVEKLRTLSQEMSAS